MPEDKKGGGAEGGYFSRFVFSLLATVVTILLVQSSFSLIAPDIGGAAPATFFGDFGAALGRIQFPELPGPPGIPSYLSDLFAQATPPTGPTTLPPTVTPTAAVKKEGIPSWVWWGLAGIAALVAAWYALSRPRGAPAEAQATEQRVQAIINRIGQVVNEKTAVTMQILERGRVKSAFIKRSRALLREALEGINDPADLWERIRAFQQNNPLKEISDRELQLLESLERLKVIERDLFRQLDEWVRDLQPAIDISANANNLKNLILATLTPNQIAEIRRLLEEINTGITGQVTFARLENETGVLYRFLSDAGIIRLIIACKDFMNHEILLEQNLEDYLREKNVPQLIELFVKNKYQKIGLREYNLLYYDYIEKALIGLLGYKVQLQIQNLAELRDRLGRTVQQQAAAAQAAGQQQAPNFSLTANPDTLTIRQGGQGTSTITVTSLNGFNRAVDLSLQDLAGVIELSTTDQVTPPVGGRVTATLMISIDNNAPIDTYNLVVSGVSGTLPNTVNLTLNVTAATGAAPGGAVLPRPPTGTVHIRATLDGNPWPDPATGVQGRLASEIIIGTTRRRRMYVPADIISHPGDCTAVFISGGPTGATLTSIMPSNTPPLAVGGDITFTFNFVTPAGAAVGGGTLPISPPLAPVVPPAGGRPSARIITPDPNSPENERTFTLDQNVTITGRVENLDMSAGRECVWTKLEADGRYHYITDVFETRANEDILNGLGSAFGEGRHTIAFYVLNAITLPDGTHTELKSGDIVIRIVPAGGSQPQQTAPTQTNQAQIDQALNSLVEMFRQELKR